MNIEPIRSLLHAEPFHPFELCLADGRSIPVGSRDLMLIMPGNKTLVVATSGHHTEYVDVRLILSLRRGSEVYAPDSDAA